MALVPHRTLQTRRFALTPVLPRPLVMGIVNVTPDSFSDGGEYASVRAAVLHAGQLLDQGADILDIGGESTRPGAQAVDAATEWKRIGPVLEEICRWNVPVSVDTQKTRVMEQALQSGIDLINDVNAFQDPGAAELLASSGAAGVVMHMQGKPQTMQNNPFYTNVVEQVLCLLNDRLEVLYQLGVKPGQLWVDPGFGFGKNLAQNQELFQALPQFAQMAAGVLVGVSRKRMIGEVTGCDKAATDRVSGSVAAALLAAQAGAAVVRVHDVAETVQALKMLQWAGVPT